MLLMPCASDVRSVPVHSCISGCRVDGGTPSGMAAFDLERFVAAQDHGGAYARALGELQRGRKVSHWMWFVFPQISGLGSSAMAQRYAISSLAEAVAYLRHPVLGPRLLECASAVAALASSNASEIFGSIDAMKLHSSMTLFAVAAPDVQIFSDVLAQYFGGELDPGTTSRLPSS